MKLAQRRQKDLICAHSHPRRTISFILSSLPQPYRCSFSLNRSCSLLAPNSSQGTLSCSKPLIYDNRFLDRNLHCMLIHFSSLRVFTLLICCSSLQCLGAKFVLHSMFASIIVLILSDELI